MFETAVVRPRVANRKLLSLSVFAHTAIVGAVIAASLASTTLPTEAPKQLMQIYYERPLPALGNPAPPRASAPHLGHPAPGQPRLPVLHTITAPQTIPSTIPNILPSAVTSTALTPSNGDIGDPSGKKDSAGSDTQASADANMPLVAGTGGVTSPVAIHRVDPVFPQSMLRGRMGGWVVLQCVIDKTGHIRDVSVVKSSFIAFEQPAIDAVQQWLFTPGTLRGQPVDVIFELTVKFQVR